MKLKDVEMKVMSDEKYGDHLNELFGNIKKGKIREPQPHTIITRTAGDIGKILTPERIRLLHTIREKKPASISELARILNRSQSNVSNDVKYLEGIGLVELKGIKDPVFHKQPTVDYDAVHITVPLTC